jgi:hypothetical protein
MIEFDLCLFLKIIHIDIISWKFRDEILVNKYITHFFLTSWLKPTEILRHSLIFQLYRFSIYPILQLDCRMQEIILLSLKKFNILLIKRRYLLKNHLSACN